MFWFVRSGRHGRSSQFRDRLGLGKDSFVAARVIHEILADDPFARVLVSAQSHHAVDNLLAEVARTAPVGADSILLRVATEHTRRKVSPDCEKHLAERLLDRLREDARQAGSSGGRSVAPLGKRWRKAVSDHLVDVDLAQRLDARGVRRVRVLAPARGREPSKIGTSPSAWVVAEEAARGVAYRVPRPARAWHTLLLRQTRCPAPRPEEGG